MRRAFTAMAAEVRTFVALERFRPFYISGLTKFAVQAIRRELDRLQKALADSLQH